MILPNELRIGNWLIDIKFGSYIRFKSFFGLCNVEANPDLYTPIPLTPEILEKAGFKIDPNSKKHAGKVYRNQGVTINLETSRNKYVHQLQNLYFALTGEELQIDL